MIVLNKHFFNNSARGASIVEVLLAMAIVAMATPFVYSQIARTSHTLHDIAVARRIMSTRDSVLNFVRMNQDKWPDAAQIRLDESELASISPDASAGLVDKYAVNGAVITDVYLAFETPDDDLRTNKIARHIGGDAAVVDDDGIAYGNTWAVAAPDFLSGDLIYRISRDVAGTDTSQYLHRGTSGEDNLNVMGRDLDMAHHHVYNVSGVTASSAQIKNGNALFVDAKDITATTAYFSSGANISGSDVSLGAVRVSGDMSGFKNIYADNVNGHGYTTTGRIITDRATITNSINVANDMIIKSDTSRTISDFTGISVSSVAVPFVSAEEMIFHDNFGLTISGELLMSTTSPLKIGNWVFPSTTPPQFSSFTLSRATRPSMPSRGEFGPLLRTGWQDTIQTTISTIN